MVCSVCFLYTQDHLPRSGTTHSKVGPPTPIISQENVPQAFPETSLVGALSQLKFLPKLVTSWQKAIQYRKEHYPLCRVTLLYELNSCIQIYMYIYEASRYMWLFRVPLVLVTLLPLFPTFPSLFPPKPPSPSFSSSPLCHLCSVSSYLKVLLPYSLPVPPLTFRILQVLLIKHTNLKIQLWVEHVTFVFLDLILVSSFSMFSSSIHWSANFIISCLLFKRWHGLVATTKRHLPIAKICIIK